MLLALGKYGQRILAAASSRPASRADILEVLGLADDYRAFARHIAPLVASGLLDRTPQTAANHLEGRGVVIIGVRDSGTPVGVSDLDIAVAEQGLEPLLGHDGPRWDKRYIAITS